MRKKILSLAIALLLFTSAFTATFAASKVFRPDDCPYCEASMTSNGKRCILNGCTIGEGVVICSYNCGSTDVPFE